MYNTDKLLLDKSTNEEALLHNEKGHDLTYSIFRSLFDKARLKPGLILTIFS